MNYYHAYTNITAIEQDIKLSQAQLKIAQLEKTEYKIEDLKKSIKRCRQRLLIAKAKMEVNKQLLIRDLIQGKKISAEVPVKEG